MAGRNKDGLGWMVMPFGETTGKRVLGRRVDFIVGHAQCEKPVTSVDMTHGSWRNMSGVLGEVLTVDLRV